MSLTVVLVILYFLALLSIGYFASRKETEEGFLIADRKVRWPSLVATLSGGYVGGGVLILLASWAFKYGFSVLWIFCGSSLGFIMFIPISKKLRALAEEHKFYTISDYIYHKFDKKTGVLGTLSVFVYFFFWLMLQFIGGGIILSSLLGISYFYAVMMVGLIILIYLILAGFKAVVKTDFFQYLIMFILGLLVLKIALVGTILTPEQLDLFRGVGGSAGVIGFLVMGVFITLLSGDIWQRIYAAKNRKNLNIGLVGAAISVFVIGLVIASIGFWAKINFPEIVPEDAFVYGIKNMLPVSLLGVSLLIVLSSIMSTADTIIFAMSMNLSRDFLSHFNKLNKESLVKYTRIFIFVLAIAAVTLSFITKDVSNFGLLAAAAIFPLGPAVIGSFFCRIKKNAAFSSIFLGLVSLLVLVITEGVSDSNVIIPFVVSLITIILLQIMIRARHVPAKR